jgi:hypothetical protein
VQVKSETSGKPAKFPWKYALKIANYENLRHDNYAVPRVLVVVAMPTDVADWVTHTPTQLSLRHCGYWISLRGLPATPNITVSLPRKQTFSPSQLSEIMTRISQGKLP